MVFLNPIVFLVLTISLYFISRATINNIYSFLSIFTKNNRFIFSVVSILYFPGTVAHEMAHFLAATILFLKVKDIKIFPKFEGNDIKLGSVVFEKQDFLRGIIVGLAPFILAFFIFYAISSFNLFPSNTLVKNILFCYLIFSISSTMFSSKKDLIDLIYLVPTVIILAGIFYVFGLNIKVVFENNALFEKFSDIIYTINFYLFYSIIINLIILLLTRITVNLIKR